MTKAVKSVTGLSVQEVPPDILEHAPHLYDRDEVPPSEEELERIVTFAQKHLKIAYDHLKPIQDKKYYRLMKDCDGQHYETWDAFCKERLNVTGDHARRQIKTVHVNQALADVGLPPLVERQARIVGDLPAEKIVEVVQTAQNEAETRPLGGRAAQFLQGKITGPLLESVRRKVVPEAPRPDDWKPPTPRDFEETIAPDPPRPQDPDLGYFVSVEAPAKAYHLHVVGYIVHNGKQLDFKARYAQDKMRKALGDPQNDELATLYKVRESIQLAINSRIESRQIVENILGWIDAMIAPQVDKNTGTDG